MLLGSKEGVFPEKRSMSTCVEKTRIDSNPFWSDAGRPIDDRAPPSKLSNDREKLDGADCDVEERQLPWDQ